METIFFGALFLASVISYSCFVKKNSKYFLGLAIIFTIFSIFTRYEAVLVPIAFFVYILYQKIFLKEGTKITYILLNFIPILFLVGLVILEFELILVNPYQIRFMSKNQGILTDIVRSIYEVCAFLAFSSPFLLLTILKLKTHLKNKFSSFLIIQMIVSLFPFIFITQWINPFYRYYIFEYPILIILGFLSLYLLKDSLEIGKYSKIVFVAVAIIFLITVNLPGGADVTQICTWTQSKTLRKHAH